MIRKGTMVEVKTDNGGYKVAELLETYNGHGGAVLKEGNGYIVIMCWRITSIKPVKVVHAETCPICNHRPDAPARARDEDGKIVSGCVDHFHSGHLVTPSESAFWHARPEAKKLRAELKKSRDGYVTEYAAH